MHRRDINGKLPELLQCRFHFEVFCGEVHSIASRCATSPCCAWLISSCHSRSIGAESTKGFIFLKNSFRFKLEWKLCIYVSSYLNMRSSPLLSSQPARFWMASQWRFTQDRTWRRIASWALNPCQSMFHFKCQGIYLLLVWRSVILASFSGPHFLSFLLTLVSQLCVWDWLLALSDEVKMIRRGQRVHRYILDMVYFVVRWVVISVRGMNRNPYSVYWLIWQYLSDHFYRGRHAYIRCLFPACSSVRSALDRHDHAAATLDTIKVLIRVIAATNIMMMPAACGLFFVRLRGVYWRDKYIIAFFGFCWLVVLGLFVSDSTRGLLRCSDAAQLTQCLEFHPYDAWGYIATAAYDTLMYLAISWKLASFSSGDRWQDRLKSFFTGDGLGWLSKILLQSGQVYYL